MFEDLVAKLKAGAAKTEDATVKQQLANIKVYKTAEGAAGGNALYVILLDPAAQNAEYELFALRAEGHDRRRKAGARDGGVLQEGTGAFAAGYNKLSLTPVK